MARVRRSQRLAYGVRRQVLADRIDVGHHRHGATRHHAARRGDESARRHDHLVARADIEGEERQFQRQRAVRQGNGMLCASEGGKLILEAPTSLARPVVHPPAGKHLADCTNLVLIKYRPRRKRRCAHGLPPLDSQRALLSLHQSSFSIFRATTVPALTSNDSPTFTPGSTTAPAPTSVPAPTHAPPHNTAPGATCAPSPTSQSCSTMAPVVDDRIGRRCALRHSPPRLA